MLSEKGKVVEPTEEVFEQLDKEKNWEAFDFLVFTNGMKVLNHFTTDANLKVNWNFLNCSSEERQKYPFLGKFINAIQSLREYLEYREKLTALENAEAIRKADELGDLEKFCELLNKDPDLIYYVVAGSDYSWNWMHCEPKFHYFMIKEKVKKVYADNLDWLVVQEKAKKYQK